MAQKALEPVFTRRGFLLFVFVAPAAILVLLTILVLAQYRQLQRVVSSHEAVPAFSWDAASEARKDSLLSALLAYADGEGQDSLALSAHDLTLLAAASPAAERQQLHVRVSSRDSVLIVETTQSLEHQNRRFSWVFQKLVPHEYRWLNARLEGVPEWKNGRLTFFPQRGFLNDGKVSRTALSKRSELSPKAWLDSTQVPVYERLLSKLDTVVLVDGGVALIRGKTSVGN